MNERRSTGVRGVSVAPYKGRRGVWRVSVSFGGRTSRTREIFVFKGTRSAALEEGARRRFGGASVASQVITLRDYFEGVFLPAKERAGRRVRTLETYRETFRLYVEPTLGELRLRELLEDESALEILERWLSWLAGPEARPGAKDPAARLSPRSQQKAFRCLYAVLRHACRGRRRAANPLDAIDESDRPSVNYLRAGQHRALPLDAARAVIEAFEGDPWEAAVAVAIGGGLRRGEILGIPLEAITELGDGRLEVEVRQVVSVGPGGARLEADAAKTIGSFRKVALPRWASASVRRQIKAVKEARLRYGTRWHDHGLLFPRMGGIGGAGRDKLGAPVHPTSLTRAFKNRVEEARLAEHLGSEQLAERLGSEQLARVRFHDLRHTHITLGAADGAVPVPVMQRRAGHVRLETTAGYLDPSRAADHLVAEAFDRLFASEG